MRTSDEVNLFELVQGDRREMKDTKSRLSDLLRYRRRGLQASEISDESGFLTICVTRGFLDFDTLVFFVPKPL